MHLVASEGIPRKSSFIRNNDNLDQLLQRFWGKKKLPRETRTTEEILCEWHFEKFTARNETGRYIEKHPRREAQNRLGRFIWRSKRLVSTARATFQGTSRMETKYITKLFKETFFRISYTTNNSIRKHLSMKQNYPHVQNKYEKSGIYQLNCPYCKMKYIGHTGRSFQMCFHEHFRDLK